MEKPEWFVRGITMKYERPRWQYANQETAQTWKMKESAERWVDSLNKAHENHHYLRFEVVDLAA